MNQNEITAFKVQHSRSIKLGEKFAQAWRGNNLSDVVDTLDAYIEARRAVPIDPNTGKRYGSYEAYESTQGYYL